MNSSLKELFDQTFNLPPKDKVEIARQAMVEINQYLESINCTEEQIAMFIANLTRLFVAIDTRTVEDEYDFFLAVTRANITPSYFIQMVEDGSDPKFINDTINLIKSFDHDVRVSVLTYGMMFMSCDDYFHFKETALIKRFLEIL